MREENRTITIPETLFALRQGSPGQPATESEAPSTGRARSSDLRRVAWRAGRRALCAATLLGVASGSAWPAGAGPIGAGSAWAQDAPAASTPQLAILLQPALVEVRNAMTSLRIAKWKAPGPVRDDAEQNVGSINRDLGDTLPPLISQADAGPHPVPNMFAVYRNLDALYEVLLRVSGTADLAAPDAEGATLLHALGTLDAARKSLADAILTASHGQEAKLEQLQQQRAAPVAAVPPPSGAATVVSDGPVANDTHKKAKAKPKTAPKTTTQPTKPTQ